MKKSTLLNYLTYGYMAELDSKEYESLKNDLIQHDKSTNASDAGVLAESIIKNYPQFQIMHDAYMRKRADKMSSDISIIKVIVLISFIASIVVGIFIASGIK